MPEELPERIRLKGKLLIVWFPEQLSEAEWQEELRLKISEVSALLLMY